MKDKGLKPLARVVSTATAHEKNLIKTDTVCVGTGFSEAYEGALKSLPPGLKIDQIICDHNGEIYRADEFGFSLARISDRLAEDRGIHTPAQCWGDCGAASGPLFAILAIEAGNKGYAKGPHSLLSASSEGGERAAVILHVENQIRER